MNINHSYTCHFVVMFSFLYQGVEPLGHCKSMFNFAPYLTNTQYCQSFSFSCFSEVVSHCDFTLHLNDDYRAKDRFS